MQLNSFLLELFDYNTKANKKILQKVKELPEKTECIRFLSHLINCQYKWMARIKGDSNQPQMDWWNPVYDLADLDNELVKSMQPWLSFISEQTEAELLTEVHYNGIDNLEFAATPKDIIVQLNFHSVHHRAQMQTRARVIDVIPRERNHQIAYVYQNALFGKKDRPQNWALG